MDHLHRKNEEDQPTKKIVSKKEAFQGKWLRFILTEHQIRNGSTKTYEYVERTTRKGVLDGVSIVGIMGFPKSNQKPKLVIVANFRPPVNQFVLEFPAGLVDSEGNGLDDAVRELQEETGLIPTKVIDILEHEGIQGIPQVGPITFSDPWKSTENEKLVLVEVDGDDEANVNAKQNLEDDEDILVHLIDMTPSIWKDIVNLAKEKGYGIESKLYTFAVAFALGKKLFK